MKQTMTKVTVSALLALVCLALFASSAQAVQIMAETGAALPSDIIVGERLTVLITDDAGTPIDGVAKSARVRYRLDSGTRIPVEVGSDGKTVNPYTPPYSGVLNITISYGTAVIASQTVNVIAAGIQTLGSITISPDSPGPLHIGGSLTFTAVCRDTNSGVMICPTLTWDSSNSAVGTINPTAGSPVTFTAAGVGTTTVTVTATYEGRTKTDTAIVNVSGSTETVPVDGDNFTETSIYVGTAANINVSGEFNNRVIGGSIVITPVADPEVNVSAYRFTGDLLALIGLVMEPNTAVRNELADGNDTIRIEICYNETELASKNIKSSTLAIWRFDGTEWVKMVKGTDPCAANGRDGNCVWINLTNLSTYALVGTKTTPSDDGGGGGGGGGGGYYPPATPTVTATAAPTAPPGATPGHRREQHLESHQW